MRFVRILLSTALLAGSAIAGLGTLADPAGAVCSSGEICYWGEDGYTGCEFSTSGNDVNLADNKWDWPCPSAWSVNQGPNSAGNFGRYCSIRFHDYAYYGGGSHWLGRNGRHAYWYIYDMALAYWSNGGTIENDISSHKWC